MQQQADRIVQTLKSKGVRVTPQRFAVYADLLMRSDHPTAEQISSHLNQDMPTSSQATIYKTLQALRDVGLVREVLLEDGVCRYDANIAPTIFDVSLVTRLRILLGNSSRHPIPKGYVQDSRSRIMKSRCMDIAIAAMLHHIKGVQSPNP